MAHEKKVTLSINLNKLSKEHFYQGKKGVYATLTLVPTPNSQYGDDYMVTQYLGKGLDSIILGNANDLDWGNNSDSNSAPLPDSMADDFSF